MVSTTGFGSTMEERYKFELIVADYKTNDPQGTSAIQRTNSDASVHQTSKDIIKQKLTARVSPMTRHQEQFLDRRLHPLTVVPSRGKSTRTYGASTKTQLTDIGTAAPFIKREPQKLAEKRKFQATNVIIAPKTVKSDISPSKRKKSETKKPRPILPRTMQVPVQPEVKPVVEPAVKPATPVSPEPKLMSDNVATMSLLSATECHLATLQDEDGDTPLHIAIAHGNTQLVEYLINLMSCLTLDIYNNLKQTPLHLAVITVQPYIVEKLVSAGANVNLPDRNGQTPTHLACNRASVECLETLVKARNTPDLELRNFNGYTPLHEAVLARCSGAVTCLIRQGAKVNCKDGKGGRTPLHHAVETENMEVIQELLKCGASASEGSFSGNTPLQIASGRSMQNVRLLLEAASTNIKPSKHREITQVEKSPLVLPKYDDRRQVIVKSTYA